MSVSLWNINSGVELKKIVERSTVEIALPVANTLLNIDIELISGKLPPGLRIEGTKIKGLAYEVQTDTPFQFVLRAHWQGHFEDRTFTIVVSGPDAPEWTTNEGLLPVGQNNTFFVLDSEIIDYQLVAVDPDISAGDEIEYFIADGDGNLPPGIELTTDGRLVGTTEPLLSLDKRYTGGGYDTMPYGDFPIDYGILSSNGYSSFYYDTQTFDYNQPTTSPKKLNRYYPFSVTATDGESFSKREFEIYVVGDDFLRSDNTLMEAGSGIFRADNTHIRTPVWITPRDLGFRRANNYTTLYLDIINPPTFLGTVSYTLEDLNDDGSISELPPGMELDSRSGEILGRIPYQPAITESYKFTIRATRFTGDLDTVTIFGTFYEDVRLGQTSFKVYKLDLTGNLDGINDAIELIDRQILINGFYYTVTNVDTSNNEYDTIFIDDTLAPKISMLMSRTAVVGSGDLFVSRLNEIDKTSYLGKTLKFSETEKYKFMDITPYIEYEITQTNVDNNPILPTNSPSAIKVFENYFVGDYIINSSENGGDDSIYINVAETTIQPQLDIEGNTITDIDGNVQIVFDPAKWNLVASSLADMTLEDRITATKQALETEFGGEPFISPIEPTRWRIKIPSNSNSRNVSNIRRFFVENDDSTIIDIKLIRDNEDKVTLDVNLNRQLNAGRNIGLALFEGDSFSKSIVIADDADEVNIPSRAKTFELQVIGEIDSTINWITPSDLGEIDANYVSTLSLEAQTSVPDSRLFYSITKGKLPFGMRLNYNGDLIGIPRQYNTTTELGLTTFDNKTMTWDGFFPGDTTFDRVYSFTVKAEDRFKLSATEREFTIKVNDLNTKKYTNIIARPLLKPEERRTLINFLSDSQIFIPESIYRPNDPSFGVQRKIEMLIYAGIEAKKIEDFVAAAAKWHKRKKYVLGDFQNAIAIEEGSTNVLYEVIYIPVIDPAESLKGKTRKSFDIDTTKKITVDSMQYAAKDDETKTGLGYSVLPVYPRNTVRFVIPNGDQLIVEANDSVLYNVDVDNNDFLINVNEGGLVDFNLTLSDSEPTRLRPDTNTIKADSNAIKVSNSKDQTRYISSLENMRDSIRTIGDYQRNYLPLWMRTPQTGFAPLEYVSAIPICYCKPGTSQTILENIKNNGFSYRNINFELDRYIVQSTEDIDDERYILFANYQFNV